MYRQRFWAFIVSETVYHIDIINAWGSPWGRQLYQYVTGSSRWLARSFVQDLTNKHLWTLPDSGALKRGSESAKSSCVAGLPAGFAHAGKYPGGGLRRRSR